MWSFFSAARVQQLSFFWSAVIIVGLFVSAWVIIIPSIGIAGLFLTSVGYSLHERCIAQRPHWRELLSFTLVYLVHLVSGLAQNKWLNQALLQDLVLQLPFVLLPLAFLLLPDWSAVYKRNLWLLLIGCCLVAALGATTNYLFHYKEIEALYLRSKVMPTEPDHIRFSLLISIALSAGAVLIFGKALSPRLRWLLVGSLVALFLFQHLLAVRSGIVTLYAAGLVGLVWLAWPLGQWKAAATGAIVIASLGVGCLLLFTTLQNKVTNTRDDTAQLDSASAANNFSITARVYSYQIAFTIIREHPIIGVSKIKLADKMAEQYSYRYPNIAPDRYVLPHNQFIYNLASYGLIGLLVFLAGYYYPLWVGIRNRNILQLLVYVIVTVSFLVEYTLESNLGVIIGLFFPLLAAAPTQAAATAPLAVPD